MRINTECFFVPDLPKNGLWGQNLDSESALPRYHVCQFSDKMYNFDFFSPNLPKNDFCGQNFKNLSPDSKSIPPRYHVCQFSGKTDIFDFFSPNRFRIKNQKTNVGIKINILKIPCMPIFRQNGQLRIFDPNIPRNGFRVGNSEN